MEARKRRNAERRQKKEEQSRRTADETEKKLERGKKDSETKRALMEASGFLRNILQARESVEKCQEALAPDDKEVFAEFPHVEPEDKAEGYQVPATTPVEANAPGEEEEKEEVDPDCHYCAGKTEDDVLNFDPDMLVQRKTKTHVVFAVDAASIAP